MAAAYTEGATQIQLHHIVAHPHGPAAAILRGNPTATYPYINAICRGTGGWIRSVSLERIEQARRLLAELEGIHVCHASAAAVAGVMEARAQGMIGGDEPVLVNLTGADRPHAPTPHQLSTVDLAVVA
jgi:threonine synthase